MTIVSGRVFCIGEAVLDIIFKNESPVAATPGGSMLNTAVSLGRAGLDVYLIGDLAGDQAGGIIKDFLEKNGVSTRHVSWHPDGKTSLALAFLDDRNDASYSFYKIPPSRRLDAEMPAAGQGDFILFGSYYSLIREVRDRVIPFIRRSRAAGAFILYDPNFRRPHLAEIERLRPWIEENIGQADLIRGSDEDFLHICRASDVKEAYAFTSQAGCSSLVYTRNSRGVEVMTKEQACSFAAPLIVPVSTVGAGDAFNAGMIHAACTPSGWLTLTGSPTLTGSLLEPMIATGIRFAANVCQSLENYITVDFAKTLKKPVS